MSIVAKAIRDDRANTTATVTFTPPEGRVWYFRRLVYAIRTDNFPSTSFPSLQRMVEGAAVTVMSGSWWPTALDSNGNPLDSNLRAGVIDGSYFDPSTGANASVLGGFLAATPDSPLRVTGANNCRWSLVWIGVDMEL